MVVLMGLDGIATLSLLSTLPSSRTGRKRCNSEDPPTTDLLLLSLTLPSLVIWPIPTQNGMHERQLGLVRTVRLAVGEGLY
jgi:hypothetical protein